MEKIYNLYGYNRELDLEDDPIIYNGYDFENNISLKERSQANRKYQHSKLKHGPDYPLPPEPIRTRWEILDFSD